MQTLEEELAKTAVAKHYFVDSDEFEELLSDPSLQDGINMVSTIHPDDDEILAKYLIFEYTIENNEREYDSRYLTDSIVLDLIEKQDFTVLIDQYEAVVDTWNNFHYYNYQTLMNYYKKRFDKWLKIGLRNHDIAPENVTAIKHSRIGDVQSMRNTIAGKIRDNLDARVLPFLLAGNSINGALLNKIFTHDLNNRSVIDIDGMILFSIMHNNVTYSLKKISDQYDIDAFDKWNKLDDEKRREFNKAFSTGDKEKVYNCK